MKRETGYYWVKQDGGWFIALYESEFYDWYVNGSPFSLKNSDFEEIGDRIETPEKYK